jgi:hypothetical protein
MKTKPRCCESGPEELVARVGANGQIAG